jgi:eukaryotic-like serine/threonine-protein kinase
MVVDGKARRTECEDSVPLNGWDHLPECDARYELQGAMARGGMGTLFWARDRILGRPVAIKVPNDATALNTTEGDRFLREARIHAQLTHANIPPLYDVGRFSNGRPYLVMKLVKGRTLDDILGDRPRPLMLYRTFDQICQAIAYAHAKGVVHRDLKPQNIMITPQGRVFVLDWGLAKLETETENPSEEPIYGVSTRVSVLGHAVGTPSYIPPEQACGELDEINERSDVFGLGAILCEMLTGQPPYIGNMQDVWTRARVGDLTSAFERLDASGAPAELVRLTKTCLQAVAHDRPFGAAEVSATFDHFFQTYLTELRRNHPGGA